MDHRSLNEKMKTEGRRKRRWRQPSIDEKKLASTELKDLWGDYQKRVRVLEARFPNDNNRTLAEREFARKLKLYTGLRFYPGFWLGSFQVDVFIPSLNALIEINGGIHNTEGKMFSDGVKFRKLCKLYGAWPIEFENRQVYNEFKRVLELLERLPRLTPIEEELQLKRMLLVTIESGL